MKAKLVRESLFEFQGTINQFIGEDIRNMMEELGYETNDSWDKTTHPDFHTSGYFEFRKRMKGGEIEITMFPLQKQQERTSMGMPAIDQGLIRFNAYFNPEKKILGKFRSPDYRKGRDLQDTEDIELGIGLFKMSDKDMLDKIAAKVQECEDKV